MKVTGINLENLKGKMHDDVIPIIGLQLHDDIHWKTNLFWKFKLACFTDRSSLPGERGEVSGGTPNLFHLSEIFLNYLNVTML